MRAALRRGGSLQLHGFSPPPWTVDGAPPTRGLTRLVEGKLEATVHVMPPCRWVAERLEVGPAAVGGGEFVTALMMERGSPRDGFGHKSLHPPGVGDVGLFPDFNPRRVGGWNPGTMCFSCVKVLP